MHCSAHNSMVTVASILMVLTIGLIQNSVAAIKLSSFRVRAPSLPSIQSFINLPKSINDREIAEFEKVKPEAGFYKTMDIYCLKRDPRVCLMFNMKGEVVGMQTSYLKSDVSEVDPNLYNFSNPNFVQTNFFNIPAYSARTYFVNPDKLTEEGRNSSSPDLIDGLWSRVDGKLERFDSRCQPNSPVVRNLLYMQGCVNQIGQIYSRKFHENGECKNAFWNFLMFDEGSMIGFGHAAPSIISPGPDEDFYNHVVRERTSKELLPNTPPCYDDLVKYDFSTMFVYLNEKPWEIRCRKCFC